MFIERPASEKSIEKRGLVYGVGVNDADYIICAIVDGKRLICPFYARWASMISRCYNHKYQEKRPTYIGCSVCDEWLTFSKFKAWMIEQDWKGNHLDKDIKISGNKTYSPEACLFVTPEINMVVANGFNGNKDKIDLILQSAKEQNEPLKGYLLNIAAQKKAGFTREDIN